ncbi:MAG: hypothetical protein FJ387_21185 [Verrucomicrobia bacterium]|nr:hypothetical protein [Verrucomicrobiota bacterium]
MPQDQKPVAPGLDRRLGRLFTLETGTEGDWRPEELRAIFEHQWGAPLQVDLGQLERGRTAKVRTLSQAEGLLLKSFRDLFTHPHPPVELLVLAKDFGKLHQGRSDGPLPREIALAIYYSSIFVALLRLGQRISQLDDATLRTAAQWMVAQDWPDPTTKSLFEKGLAARKA